MIARLRRWLLGPPCPLCSLPVPREPESTWDDHLEWHRLVEVMAGRPDIPPPQPRDLLPEHPVRPARRDRRRNGGPG